MVLLGTKPPRDSTPAEKIEFYSIPEPNSGCLLWLGGCDGHGAAFMELSGVQVRAARAAWVVKNGLLPDDAQVLHKCDNPGCVNADHLFLGNHQDNMADKTAKGRQARGAYYVAALRKAHALYQAAKAGELRIMAIADDPRPLKVVAADLDVSPRTIRKLKRKIAAFRSSLPVPQKEGVVV